MKQKTTTMLGVFSALLLLSVAAVYAHTGTRENTQPIQSSDGMMIDESEMNEMHDLMTKELDPKLKEQMDIMHKECINQFKEQANNNAYMGEVNMMPSRTFNGIMRMGGMMS